MPEVRRTHAVTPKPVGAVGARSGPPEARKSRNSPNLAQNLPAVADDQNPFHSRPKKLQVGWKKNHDSGRDHLFLVYMSYEGPTCPLAKAEVGSKWWVSVRDL